LILAAADFAEGKTNEPPRELSLLWSCDRFHVLPRAGGLLDQPFGLMQRMRVCENVCHALELWKAENWGTFQEKHPAEWDIVQQVMTLRGETSEPNSR
jgi:hypothetical protein